MLAELSLQPIVDRLEGVGPNALYGLIFLASFVEGVLPPVPGDAAAAFLAFLAARAGGYWLPTTAAVVLGSVVGNCIVWWLGRRFGAEWLAAKMLRFGFKRTGSTAETVEHRIEDAYREYGWVALFVSRFIPGMRAMAPAAAGALRVPLWKTAAILLAASALWYSVVTWIAFKVGSDWDVVKETLGRFARDAGLGALAVVIVLVTLGLWMWRRRRSDKH